MKKKLTIFSSFTLIATLFAVAVYATVTFDPATGAGFVGKGDVQYTFGWNNAQLQAAADNVQFRASSTSVTVAEWTCDRDAGPQTLERSRTTTTSTQGLVDSIGRLKTQITGFNLNGYDGAGPTTTTVTAGPPLNSCPNFWTSLGVTTTTEPGTSTLEVSGDGGSTWTPLLEKP